MYQTKAGTKSYNTSVAIIIIALILTLIFLATGGEAMASTRQPHQAPVDSISLTPNPEPGCEEISEDQVWCLVENKLYLPLVANNAQGS